MGLVPCCCCKSCKKGSHFIIFMLVGCVFSYINKWQWGLRQLWSGWAVLWIKICISCSRAEQNCNTSVSLLPLGWAISKAAWPLPGGLLFKSACCSPVLLSSCPPVSQSFRYHPYKYLQNTGSESAFHTWSLRDCFAIGEISFEGSYKQELENTPVPVYWRFLEFLWPGISFQILSLGRKLCSKVKHSVIADILECCIFHILFPDLASIVSANAVSSSHANVMASDIWSYILTVLLEYFAKQCTVLKSWVRDLCSNFMAVTLPSKFYQTTFS